MDILWISLISQIGRNHKNMWKNSVFWKIPDKVWTFFGFISWQKSSKNQQVAENSGKTRFFLPCCSVPVIYVFLYFYIYLQSPEVIQSSDPPQPIALLSAYLSTYIILYIYIYVFIFIFIHLPAITCSHSKFRPSPTYCPTVLFIYVYIYIYLFIFIYIYLQSPAVSLSSDPPQPIDLLSAYLSTYIIIYICIYF